MAQTFFGSVYVQCTCYVQFKLKVSVVCIVLMYCLERKQRHGIIDQTKTACTAAAHFVEIIIKKFFLSSFHVFEYSCSHCAHSSLVDYLAQVINGKKLSQHILLHFLMQNIRMCFLKGQLISKCPFGVFKSSKKTNEFFSRISALLASKKRSNQKSSVRESK